MAEDVLRSLCYDLLKNSAALQPDIAWFDRLDEGDPERSLKYLQHCWRRHNERNRVKMAEEASRLEISKIFGSKTMVNATPAPVDGESLPTANVAKTGKPEKPKSLELCRYYAEGKCSKTADKCRYTHANNAVPAAWANKGTGKGKGNQKQQDGKPDAPKPKKKARSGSRSRSPAPDKLRTVICRYQWSSTGCRHGNECNWKHTDKPPDKPPVPAGPAVPQQETAEDKEGVQIVWTDH
jgi:hypothetical protein